MSQADDDTTTSVIPLRRQAAPEEFETATELETRVACLEMHLASMEKALLVLAHSPNRQRTLLEQVKVAQGWRWDMDAEGAFFGDAVLFEEYELQVRPK